ncbi:MAG: FAD-dependent oxidoreductase [Aeromicrobium sp.]|uniref:FAD-dependent oxidoreductase n=1 Tax=Aeromicrobium sp. TaxID=1871063 RepID=UPI003C62A06D
MARVVVIGANAAGATVAANLNRTLSDEHEVVLLERSNSTSYSACGIPYWVAGDVDSVDDLVARTPQEHRDHGIDLRLGVEVTGLDIEARRLTLADGETLDYDRLVLATGAEPIRPDLPGIGGGGILGVQSLEDGQAVLDAMAQQPRRVVVVGSGYIGLEMAEACVTRGFDTTVVERADTPLPIVESELGEQIAEAMRSRGITLRSGTDVTGFTLDGGRVVAVEADGDSIPADLVILGLGVQARTELAVDVGLPTGPRRSLLVGPHQRVEGHDDIWAAGDCVASVDRVTGEKVHIALGTHANKQGMVAAASIAADVRGDSSALTFPGVVQTAITKFCSLEISRTGLGVQQARDAGFDPVSASIVTTNIAGYMPGAAEMTVLMIADRSTRRLLGAQIVGAEDAALRIDVAGTALAGGLTVDEVVMLDLAYAPPFGSVWSPLQVAARAVVRALDS